MHQLSLRFSWLKLETSGDITDHLRGIYRRIYLKRMKAVKPEDGNM